jgi:hypothetical protein
VRTAPLPRVLLQLLVPAALWALVVVGRRICLVAQRLPPAVRLVRALRAWLGGRAAAAPPVAG